jgi:thioredoxin
MRFIKKFFLPLQHKIKNNMNKILIIASVFVLLSASACNSKGGNKEEDPAAVSSGKTETSMSIAGEGTVVHLTAEQFRDKVWDYKANPGQWVYKGDLPCLIDFYADWCRPCKMVAPIMDELAAEYKGKIRIYKIDTEAERELAGVFNIRTIPAVLFVPKNGQPQMSVGALPKPTFIQAINDVLLVK